MDDWPPSFVDALAAHHEVVVFDNAGVGRTSAVAAPALLSITAMASQTSALISALAATPPGRARMVNGRHDRAGSGCQPPGPGKPAYPGRYRSRDREGSAPPALRHRVRPEPRGDSGPGSSRRIKPPQPAPTSTPSSSTQASTRYPPPHFTASTSQLSDGWQDRTQRAGWWEISGCPRWSPAEPRISSS